MSKARLVISVLTLSAVGFIGITSSENYTDTAVIPVVGDRPTVGFGSTFKEDGSPVRMGDTTKPALALKRALHHINKDETILKQCVNSPLFQEEYDVLVDFSYQYGAITTCKSSIVSNINVGDYVAACNSYLNYKYVAKYDCSQLINGKPNKRCYGVYLRSKSRVDKCLNAGK